MSEIPIAPPGQSPDIVTADARANTPLRLRRAVLHMLPPSLSRPAYDPALLRAGIVHVGLGNFHRAHMARYTHKLVEHDRHNLGWGIIGAGLLPGDRGLQDMLAAQDWLYTLIERDGGGEVSHVIGSLCAGIYAGDDSAALLDAIDGPAIRIVSLTVTERGYCLDPATKRLDPAHPLIAADLPGTRQPRSAIGILVEAWRRRMIAGRPAFTALSCDNIQHNGDILRNAIIDFAGRGDPALADWIATHARCPNSMVDRITPVTSAEDIVARTALTAIADAAPVFCEPFTQWVIEDDFADGRPAWDAVGAQFVADVTPYEKMKLRLLNASHLAIAEIGRLLGYSYVDEAMRDVALAGYVDALMRRETGPTLDPVPGVDIDAYRSDVVQRFANPTIHDTLERIHLDAPLNYLLDPVRDRLARGETIELLALAIAAWLTRWREDMAKGGAAGNAAPADRDTVYFARKLFGGLKDEPAFRNPVAKWLAVLESEGGSAALRDFVPACGQKS